MPLLQLRQIVLRYAAHPLLDGADFQVEEGERVCLVGRNGAGKTSLMRLLAGEETPNSGEVIRPPGTVVARLDQEVPQGIPGTVFDVIHSGLRLDRHEEEWESDVRIEELAEAMGLPLTVPFSSLSGGLKRRVLLAKALAGKPDVLLLDEPTNHLDLDSILWLEKALLSLKPTLFFVTHDRAFLRKLATRIVELDRGKLTSWSCGYDEFLVRKAAALEAEEKQRAAFDKKLAQEEAWLRQGVKARRTRNEGRVRALEKMRVERGQRREREGTARLGISGGTPSGYKVIEAQDVSFSYGGSPVVQSFTSTLCRGDKIGIVGPNGAGKTTLLKLLLGPIGAPGRDGEARHQPPGRLPGPAPRADRRGEDRGPERRGRRGKRHLPGPLSPHPQLPAGLPFPRRPHPHAGEGPFRRRTQPAPVGPPLPPARQRPGPRRADERPRRGDAGTAGRAPGRVRRDAPPGFPRPRLSQ
ncbi:MAG: ATP-binding cassette domain-containing protein [Verrucomicrobium sp.]|nr:ATP-binding cassette domain-containing protein [Verrucomicrobium sp.]